jgi:TRAP-type C4-dicarboxylate transport system permease small subunit
MKEGSDDCTEKQASPGRLSQAIARLENAVISILLCSMVSLVLIQIVLRNFFSTGIMGGAEMVRHLVLWIAFLGAAMTAREGKNITIDAVYRILPTAGKRFAETLTGGFTAIICGMLLYASIRFIALDYQSGTTIAFFDIPVWTLEVIIPTGYFAVMLWYAFRSLQSMAKIIKRSS